MHGKHLRRWPIVAATLGALATPGTSLASHEPGFGHFNTQSTRLDCNVNSHCFLVTQGSGGSDATGLWALKYSVDGVAPAVLGETASDDFGAVAVNGIVTSSAPGGLSAAVRGTNSGTGDSGIGVYGEQMGSGWGVYGVTSNGVGVLGMHSGSGPTGDEPGVYGVSFSTTTNASGVRGEISANSAGASGVWGRRNSGGALGIGVRGEHYGSGNGVYGWVNQSLVGAAGVLGFVQGTGGGGVAVHGHHNGSGYGVYGNTSGAGAGVVGNQTQPAGFAGFFAGRVHVTGTLTKGGGAFKIDHPLDPANKYLQHSFVESPDMLNVYNGNVTTDARGFATVKLPRYFQALNRDFRYQLTSLSGLQEVAVAKKIANNRFTIQSEKSLSEVSWQVTGIRKDRWANANRLQPEVAKRAGERGEYLNPELYGASKAKSVLALPGEPRRIPDGSKVTVKPQSRR